LLCVLLATPVFGTGLHALKITNGLVGSLPVYADQLAIGCLLAIFAARLPKIKGSLAFLMVVAIVLIPWFPAVNATRTLFELFFLYPVQNFAIAGVVLHVIQVPYRALNWPPVEWLGRVSYSLYLWQEVFCSNRALHGSYQLALLALGCASLSYYLVEKPMLRVRDRLARKSPSTAIIATTEKAVAVGPMSGAA
jgi:peptidoglycan/LPS O-acetylase OafA/YrhL